MRSSKTSRRMPPRSQLLGAQWNTEMSGGCFILPRCFRDFLRWGEFNKTILFSQKTFYLRFIQFLKLRLLAVSQLFEWISRGPLKNLKQRLHVLTPSGSGPRPVSAPALSLRGPLAPKKGWGEPFIAFLGAYRPRPTTSSSATLSPTLDRVWRGRRQWLPKNKLREEAVGPATPGRRRPPHSPCL